MSVGYFPATPMEPIVWFSEALMVATSTVSISCHSSPVLHACVPLCFSSRHWAQSPLKQASIVEGPIWKCGWWTWNSGQYVIWGQQTHLWSLLLKEVQIHVQYIMSIWKYLEPANRSMHAFFLSPLINLLPLPVLASVSKRDWFLIPIRLFILPNCVYRHWESAPPPCTPGHLLWSACMSISVLLPRQPGNFAISGMLSLFGCKWSMSPSPLPPLV